MRIVGSFGSIPPHVMKAYGLRPTAATPPTASLNSIGAPTRADAYRPRETVQQLIAGKVSQPVDFNAAPPARPAAAQAQVFQLYTRAADRIEAAVAVQLGRTLDVKA